VLSAIEHPLGKGEVECSIHSGSTIKTSTFKPFNRTSECVFDTGYTAGRTARRPSGALLGRSHSVAAGRGLLALPARRGGAVQRVRV
jgi:hypothetical protein